MKLGDLLFGPPCSIWRTDVSSHALL